MKIPIIKRINFSDIVNLIYSAPYNIDNDFRLLMEIPIEVYRNTAMYSLAYAISSDAC